MTDAVLGGVAVPAVWKRRARDGAVLPVLTVLLVLLAVWYVAAVWLNAPQVTERLNRGGMDWGVSELVAGTWAMERPVLPAPHQVAAELYDSVFGRPVTSKRSLVYHAQVTLSATVAGFALGLAMGVLLAIGIVHVTVLDRSGAVTTIDASMRITFTAGGKRALEEQREALEAWRRSR